MSRSLWTDVTLLLTVLWELFKQRLCCFLHRSGQQSQAHFNVWCRYSKVEIGEMVMTRIDERPPVWIGHVFMTVTDVKQSAEFMCKLGMREIFQADYISVFELRGGTHLLLRPALDPIVSGTVAPFDLMVDDLEISYEKFEALGLSPSTIQADTFHRSFTLCDPSGCVITVNSSHVSDLPV